MNNNIIFDSQIFRDGSGRLILADDIYDAVKNSKSTTSYEFAMHMNTPGKATDKDYNYYAGWFILIKNEGGIKKCIKASTITKKAKDSDSINKMIACGELVLSNVQINSAEEVFESEIKNSENDMNSKKDNNIEEYYAFADKETKQVEDELKDILLNFDVKTENYYKDLKYRLSELKDRSYYIYSKSLGYSYGNDSITADAEKRYNIMGAKIDAVMGKLEITYDETLGNGIKKDKIYYTYSDEKYPALIDTRLKEIKNDINSYTEDDYTKIKSKLSALYNDAYSIYQLSLNTATELNCATKILLDEAIKKYREVVEIISKEEAKLEGLHNINTYSFGNLIKKLNNNE